MSLPSGRGLESDVLKVPFQTILGFSEKQPQDTGTDISWEYSRLCARMCLEEAFVVFWVGALGRSVGVVTLVRTLGQHLLTEDGQNSDTSCCGEKSPGESPWS